MAYNSSLAVSFSDSEKMERRFVPPGSTVTGRSIVEDYPFALPSFPEPDCSMADYLKKHVGRPLRVTIELNGRHFDRTGILETVNNTYIVLRIPKNGSLLLLNTRHIILVNIY